MLKQQEVGMNRFVSGAIVSVIAIGVAHAQEGPAGHGWRGGGAAMFRSADANGDGVVTRAEYQAAVDARFARLDANGDGVLSPDERPGPGRRAMHGGDGAPPPPPPPPSTDASAGMPPAPASVTRDAFRAQAMRRFDATDTNHDGKIDATEMQTMLTAFRGGPGAMMPTPGDGAPR
jgi:hypothetical protein